MNVNNKKFVHRLYCDYGFFAALLQNGVLSTVETCHLQWDHMSRDATGVYGSTYPSSNSTCSLIPTIGGLHLPEFHVCISNGCNAIVRTRFCWLSRTYKHTNTCQNTRNHLSTTRLVAWTTFWFVDTYARPDIHVEINSRFRDRSWQIIPSFITPELAALQTHKHTQKKTSLKT